MIKRDRLPYPWTKEFAGNIKKCEFCTKGTFARFYKWDGCRVIEEQAVCGVCDSRFILLLELAE